MKNFNNFTQEEEENFVAFIRNVYHSDIEKYLENGGDINQQSSAGETLLMHSVVKNNLLMLNYLLENGADPNIQARNGWTCLIIAAHYHLSGNSKIKYESSSELGVISKLIESGANWNLVTDNDGDFLQMLDNNLFKIIIEKYPEQYKKYLRKKESKNFNL